MCKDLKEDLVKLDDWIDPNFNLFLIICNEATCFRNCKLLIEHFNWDFAVFIYLSRKDLLGQFRSEEFTEIFGKFVILFKKFVKFSL
jgi:hypothetical protein